MTEAKEKLPVKSVKERLRERLGGAWKIGYMTYCFVAEKELPHWFIPRIENLPERGEITMDSVRMAFNEGRVWIAVGGEDKPQNRRLEKNPESVLQTYQELLEDYSRHFEKAKPPIKAQIQAIIKTSPGIQNDPLFSSYWPDIFLFLRDDKSFKQYSITHLRAVILGFGKAAIEFGDLNVGAKATELVFRFPEKTRQDPLELAGFMSY